MIPLVGRQYRQNASVLGGTAYSNWYIGLLGADFTLDDDFTLATLLAAAAEFTGYSQSQRVLFDPYALGSGSTLVNTEGVDPEDAQLARYDITAPGMIYGTFLTHQPAKLNTTGVLLTINKLSTAQPVVAGNIIRVNHGLVVASV